MKKGIIIILSLILTISIYAEYIVSNGDEIEITIIKKNFSVLNFTTKVNENGVIKLYDYNKNNDLNNFNQNTISTQNKQKDMYIPIGIMNVNNLSIKDIKNRVYDFYKNIVDIQSIDIALSKSKYNVFIQLSNSIEALKYKRNAIYRDYINMSERAGAFSGDSVYIKKDNVFYKKSVIDTVEPGITIIINYNSIYVNGEVRKPGSYPYIPEWTYLEYIARAGGLTSNASIYRIKIMDKFGKKKSKKSLIKPGDIIYVPNNFMYYIKNFSLILSVAISLLYIINTGFNPFWE